MWWSFQHSSPTTMCVCVCVKSFSYVWLFATLWTVACQATLSMGFSRQEYWTGLPCSPPGDLPNPGIKSMSLKSLALPGRFFTTSATWEATPITRHSILLHAPILGSNPSSAIYLSCVALVKLLNTSLSFSFLIFVAEIILV